MGNIKDAFDSAFRDFAVDGVPASGEHEPVKSEIRAAAAAVETVVDALAATKVDVSKTTRALLDADLAWADGSIGLVTADPTPANNDIYVKSGASGAGSWTLTTTLSGAVESRAQPFVDAAETAADIATAAAASVSADHALIRDNANFLRSTTSYSSPADYFRATGVFGAWYDPSDLTTLFQDRAGTIPVTASGQLVGHIRDKSGNGMHLTAPSDAFRPTFIIDTTGRYLLRFIASTSLVNSALSRPIVMPRFLLGAVARPVADASSLFGFVGTASERFTIQNQSIQNRIAASLVGPSLPLKSIASQFEEAPINAPAVVGSLAVAGVLDVAVDGGTKSTVATAWTGGSTTTGSVYYGLNANSATTSLNGVFDYFGGVFLEADPGTWRERFVDYFKRVIERPAAATDLNILVISDSTGDAEGEWVYRFGQYLAAQNPGSFVGYRLYTREEDLQNRYHPEIAISAPTETTAAIRIYNDAISGSTPQQHMGDNFGPAIASIPEPDVIIWNHGHNITGWTTLGLVSRFMGAMEQVRLQWPGVPHMALRQNPWMSGDQMAPVVAALDTVAGIYGDMVLINIYQRYIDLAKDPALYADNVHPSIPTGVDEWMAVIQAAWEANWPMAAAAPAFLGSKATNLLSNGNFERFTGSTPDDWTVVGDGTVKRDASVRDGDHPYSVQIINGATAATMLRQAVAATSLQGQTVTLAVRHRLSASGSTTTGQIKIASDGTGAPSEVNYPLISGTGVIKGSLGWMWSLISLTVPADATTLTIDLKAADEAGAAKGAAWLDRAVLVSGATPRDAL